MKKVFAMILVLTMMLALSVTAFAEMRSVLEWNEEEQHWEIRIYEVEDDVTYINPRERTDLGQGSGGGLTPDAWERIHH